TRRRHRPAFRTRGRPRPGGEPRRPHLQHVRGCCRDLRGRARPGRRVKYAFRWRERAVRQLRAIPQPAALTILRALTPLGDDPRRLDANVKKLAGYEDRYRLRVGDYRVIYDVTDKVLVILVVGVGHRREIYRAMS